MSETGSLDTAIVRGPCQEKRVKTDSSVAPQVQKVQASPILRADGNYEVNKETVSETYVESNDLTVDGSVESSNMKSENIEVHRNTEANIEGRRVIDIGFVWTEIHRMFDSHAQETGCHFHDWKLVNTRRRGLLTQLFFRCELCKYEDKTW